MLLFLDMSGAYEIEMKTLEAIFFLIQRLHIFQWWNMMHERSSVWGSFLMVQIQNVICTEITYFI